MAFIEDAPVIDRDKEVAAYWAALEEQRDEWVVACIGTEVPVIKDGRWQLRVFNPAMGRSGWLDYGTDIVDVDMTGDPVSIFPGDAAIRDRFSLRSRPR